MNPSTGPDARPDGSAQPNPRGDADPSASRQDEAAAYLDADHAWRKDRPPQLDRLERSLALLPEGLDSLLDVGIGEGDWLRLLATRRPGLRLAALDLSPQRLLDLRLQQADGSTVATHQGDVSDSGLPDESFDAVTLLEVIEHVPDWQRALREALRLARRGVLVTVPYREQLMSTVCVHCHRATPLWGHLHSFDERSLDELPLDASIRWTKIPQKPRREDGLLRFVYRSLRPQVAWIGFWLDKKPA